MMGGFRKRERGYTEYVMELEDGLDAKGFDFQYRAILRQMTEDGVDMSYDDAFTVIATEEELIFRTQAVLTGKEKNE